MQDAADPEGSPDARRVDPPGSHGWFRELVLRAPFPMGALRADGAVIFLNPASEEACGYTTAELARQGIWATLFPGDAARQVREILRDLEAHGEVHDREISIVRKDGTERTLRGAGVLRKGPATGELEILFAGKDVTGERQLQEQLLQVEKLSAIGQLVAGIAHELNNPLTGIVGFAEVLLLDERDPERRETLEKITREGHRAAQVIRDLLTFARQHKVEKTYGDVNEAAERVVKMRSYETRVAGIALTADLEADLPRTLFDPSQIRQVVLSLVINAEQAIHGARKGTRIVVRTRRAGERIRVEVEDDGPGIPPEHIPRLFLPFFSTKPVGSGTGLGLSTCYGILKEHQGEIGVRRNEVGGATFFFELPILRPPEGAGAPSKRDFTARGAHVLVVEDEPTVTAFLRTALRRLGHTLVCATTAEEALQQARAVDFDVVLADVRMPGIGGRGLYEALLRERPDLAARVVFETGDTVSPETKAFVRGTGRPLLEKPFTVEALSKAIGAVLTLSAAVQGIAREEPIEPGQPAS